MEVATRIKETTIYPPDMDRIIISGDGNELYPAYSVYESEYATLNGSAASSAGFCGNCSGLAAVGNLGGAPQNTVTFDNEVVLVKGRELKRSTYQRYVERFGLMELILVAPASAK